MRIVLCDGDDLLRSMVEVMVARQGHDLVGVADTPGAAVRLLEAARPDVAIVDLALGVNADFDIIDTAQSVEAKVIVFSRTAYAELLHHYAVQPVIVPKPELDLLEQVLADLAAPASSPPPAVDRRRRPSREASGPAPTGVGDAQAFYEALNGAVEGDALVWIALATEGAGPSDWTAIAERMLAAMRGADRLLGSPEVIRVFLAGAGQEGIDAFRGRLEAYALLRGTVPMRSIVMRADESPIEAFERLKRG